MTEQNKRRKRGVRDSSWEPEEALDLAATLQDLIDEPPFKDVSDETGESTTAGARIPNWLVRRIVKLKELSGSPYDINSDVIRDAIYVGLRVLHLRYKLTADWEVETKLAGAVDAVSAGRRVRRQVDELVAGLDEMYRDGDVDKAAHNLTEYVLAAVALESEWHKDKVFQILGENRLIGEIAEHCGEAVQKILEKGKEKKRKGKK